MERRATNTGPEGRIIKGGKDFGEIKGDGQHGRYPSETSRWEGSDARCEGVEGKEEGRELRNNRETWSSIRNPQQALLSSMEEVQCQLGAR